MVNGTLVLTKISGVLTAKKLTASITYIVPKEVTKNNLDEDEWMVMALISAKGVDASLENKSWKEIELAAKVYRHVDTQTTNPELGDSALLRGLGRKGGQPGTNPRSIGIQEHLPAKNTAKFGKDIARVGAAETSEQVNDLSNQDKTKQRTASQIFDPKDFAIVGVVTVASTDKSMSFEFDSLRPGIRLAGKYSEKFDKFTLHLEAALNAKCTEEGQILKVTAEMHNEDRTNFTGSMMK